MNKSIFLALSLIVVLLLTACGGAPSAQAKPVQPTLSAVKASSKIIAEGKVVPVRSASLSMAAGGIVAQVLVKEGDRVDAGQPLVQLVSKGLELQLAQGDANLASAQAKLAQVKRGPGAEELAAAQQALKSAQADYDSLLKPNQNDLTSLKADVDKAKAALDRAQAAYDRTGGDSNPYAGMMPERAALQSAWLDYQKALSAYQAKTSPTDAQIQQALSAIQNAKSQLAKLTPAPEDVAAAEANVKAQQAARDLDADNLADAKLSAPFAGIVAALNIKPGEQANPGTAVLQLADVTAWQVDTTDLTEINIVRVKEGDAATLTFDALPDVELTGKVARIKALGENRQGDIVYTVTIKPDKNDERLRWNMTAKVSIGQ